MHCGILACALVALALISVGTCSPVSPYDRYARESMHAAADKYGAQFVRAISANGRGGYDYYYRHYYYYDVTFVVKYHYRPYTHYICDATAHWRRGYLHHVDTRGCRRA